VYYLARDIWRHLSGCGAELQAVRGRGRGRTRTRSGLVPWM